MFLSDFKSFTTFTILLTPPLSAPNADKPAKISIKRRTPPFFRNRYIPGVLAFLVIDFLVAVRHVHIILVIFFLSILFLIAFLTAAIICLNSQPPPNQTHPTQDRKSVV